MTLDEVVASAVERALLAALPKLLAAMRSQENQDRGRPLSASEAARRAKVRASAVLGALKTGNLPGRFNPKGHGKFGSWRISPADLDRWAAERQ